MIYASSIFFFTVILALARITIATPACLIAAMGAQLNPADLKALCGSLEPQVYGNITEKCSSSAESAAISVYSATCLASASVTILIHQLQRLPGPDFHLQELRQAQLPPPLAPTAQDLTPLNTLWRSSQQASPANICYKHLWLMRW